jgi:hypothetical protein
MYKKQCTFDMLLLQIVKNSMLSIGLFCKMLENSMFFNRLFQETYANLKENHAFPNPAPSLCLSDVSSMRDASQMSLQRAMPLMWTSQMLLRRLLSERCLSDVSSTSDASTRYMSLRCLSYASSVRDASHMPSQRTFDTWSVWSWAHVPLV